MTWHQFLHDLGVILWASTWGNNMAALEWTAFLALVAFLGRHHIGRSVAAWWDKWHGPHAVKRHRQALLEHEAAKREDGTQ